MAVHDRGLAREHDELHALVTLLLNRPRERFFAASVFERHVIPIGNLGAERLDPFNERRKAVGQRSLR